MSFTIPAGYTLYTSSNNGNRVTYVHTTNTSAAPRYVSFSRVLPVWQKIANAMGWSIPSYRIQIAKGVLDVNGNPMPTKVTADLTLRWPNGHASNLADVVGDLNGIIDADGFAAAVAQGQYFPGQG